MSYPLLNWLALSATALSAVSAVLLYVGTLPIRGGIQFVGAGQTEQDIEASERRRKRRVRIGLGLLALVIATQAIVVWADKVPPGFVREVPKFELQGFSIDRKETKSAFSQTVTYNAHGNLVLVSPAPPDGHHYEVWLKTKLTCSKNVKELIWRVEVFNGIGDVDLACTGARYLDAKTNSFQPGEYGPDVPQEPPVFEWGGVVGYRQLSSASLTVRK